MWDRWMTTSNQTGRRGGLCWRIDGRGRQVWLQFRIGNVFSVKLRNLYLKIMRSDWSFGVGYAVPKQHLERLPGSCARTEQKPPQTSRCEKTRTRARGAGSGNRRQKQTPQGCRGVSWIWWLSQCERQSKGEPETTPALKLRVREQDDFQNFGPDLEALLQEAWIFVNKKKPYQ